MAAGIIICITVCLIAFSHPIHAACTWPTDFVDSTWVDSLKGDLVFGSTQMNGWPVDVQLQASADLQTINEWECVLYDGGGPYLVMKTTQTFVQFVVNMFYGYRCLKLEKITDASYRYYQMDPIQTQLDYIRLTANSNSSLNDTAFLCEHPSVSVATGSEFQVMIKKGFESVAMVTCPYTLLVDYTFTYVDTSDSTLSCDQNTDVGNIDLCSNVTMITLQNPPCSQYPVYSDSNTSMCIDVVVVGSDIFVSLYNTQYDSSNPNTNIHQFACVGINSDGTSMSVTPEHCKADQSPTEIPVTNANQALGSVWALTATGAPCPPCPELTDPNEGTVTIATNGAITSATYTCNTNYTLSGNETRICQTDGTWSGDQPSCICPTLSSPTNGGVTLSADGLNATFTCTAGYILDGNSVLTCDVSTNLWSDTSPVCNECEQLSAPSSGSIDIVFIELTSVVSYECDVGTTLVGDITRTCQQDTTWTLSAPTCVSCPTLSSIDSGNFTTTISGTATVATYTCLAGYELIGDNTSVCTTSGTWDSSPPSCQCITPSSPTNGSLTVSTDKTDVTYTCDLGFTIDGPSVRYCLADGTGWSSVDPSCTLCQALINPTDGSSNSSTNGTITTAVYSCDVGFTMNGDRTSKCSSDGTWTITAPTCSECNVLPNVLSGSYTFKTNGTTTYAEYECDVGTTINGDVTVSCDVNGDWASTSANISCVMCPGLSGVTGRNFKLDTNGTSTVAELSCVTGYEMTGDATIECQSDGTWSSDTTNCVKIGSSTESESSSDLLPAVIAMAVVIALLVGGLIVCGVWVWKIKKSGTSDLRKSSTESKPNGISAAIPPLSHQHSVIDFKTPFSTFIAPNSHSNTPRPGSLSNNTRSLSSVLSAGSLNFDLVRETTSSSVFNDHPAPWSSTRHSKVDDTIDSQHFGPFPPIQENSSNVQLTNQHIDSPRKKKMSFGKKRLNTVRDVGDEHKPKAQKKTGKMDGNANGSKPGAVVPKPRHTHSSKNTPTTKTDDIINKIPKLDLGEKTERGTTPVSHSMDVNKSDKIGTPRSNIITTVQ